MKHRQLELSIRSDRSCTVSTNETIEEVRQFAAIDPIQSIHLFVHCTTDVDFTINKAKQCLMMSWSINSTTTKNF